MIDVIIPAYNAHETIERTLMSLAIQRLAKFLDVLIIDDGSDDVYDRITDKFKTYFSSIKIIRLNKNRGVGFCRQLGLDNTYNDWIYFIDSDDYMVSSFAFNRLIQAQRDFNADLVWASITQELNKVDTLRFQLNGDLWQDMNGCILYFHGKMYRREILTKYKLTIPPTRSNEDIGFNMALFTLLPKDNIARLLTPVVETICNTNSITRNENSTRLYHINNVNENMDAYVACKHAFDIVYANLGKKANPKTCAHFIDKYMNLYCKCILAEFENDEMKTLFENETALYYRDIVLPLIANWPVPFKLAGEFENSFFNFWPDSLKLKAANRPEINAWSKENLERFDQTEFDRLSKIYLTEEGYGKK